MTRSKSGNTADQPSPFDRAGKHIEQITLTDEVSKSYLEYSYSVIHSRALPDARDGLKPVHRRILYSMIESGLRPDHAYVKSARVVGDAMGKYHPHGDSSIYEALVRLAQDFSMSTPVVDGHGNFGSPNDGPAASRYCVVGSTRVRLADGTTPRISDLVNLPADSEADADFEVFDKDGKSVHVSRVFNSGVWDTLKVTTAPGYSIRGSENHLVLTLAAPAGVPMFQWMRLDELKPGMFLALARNVWEQVIPTSREYALGVLMGGWVTEGWTSTTRAGFNNTDKVFFDEVLSAYDLLVGGTRYINTRKTRRDRKQIWEMDIQKYDQLAVSPLAEMIGKQSRDKIVPEVIWNSPLGTKRAFLMATFEGDGSVHGGKDTWKNPVVQYGSYSEELCDGIQELLLEFGVASSKRSYVRASGSVEYRIIITSLPAIRAFSERVGFLPTKQAKLNAILRKVGEKTGLGHDSIPFVNEYVMSEAPRGGRNWLRSNSIRYPHRWHANKMMIQSKIRNEEVMRVLEPIMESGYRFVPVITVEKTEPEEVYSLRVDSEDHSFLAGGFVNHNTECRLAKVAMGMVGELGEETVDMAPNYDGSLQEPVVLPAAYPYLLVNGAAGIAVGMATNMIPHNLGEAIAAARLVLKKPGVGVEELMRVIPGPDLPTGGTLLGLDQVRLAYETGKGAVRLRASVSVEPLEGSRGRMAIVVSSLPYQVGSEKVIEAIKGELAKKRLQGIADVKDLSDRLYGTRLIIECKAGVNPQALLADLWKYTPLETSFSISNLALVSGQPRTLGLKEMLEVFVAHRVDVVTRRTQYRLRKAEARKHIVDGLLIALDNIDEVVKIIRGSKDTSVARAALIKRFKLSDIQAGHILDMPLRRLVGLEVETLRKELAELVEAIAGFNKILNDEKVLTALVDKELAAFAAEFATPRRTVLIGGDLQEVLAAEAPALGLEVADDPCEVFLSTSGLLLRTAAASEEGPEAGRKRSGRVRSDTVLSSCRATARGQVLLVSNRGRAFKVDVLSLPPLPPTGGTVSLRGGVSAGELVPLVSGERIVVVAPLGEEIVKGSPGLALGTREGVVKVCAPDWPLRSGEFELMGLKSGDEIVGGGWIENAEVEHVVFVSSDAQLLHFPVKSVRPQGRSGGGMAGLKLGEGHVVKAFAVADPSASGDDAVLVVSYSGVSGKVTPLAEYPSKGRGTGGVRCQRFLKGEDHAELVWVGRQPGAASLKGEPLELPEVDKRRDASGSVLEGVEVLGRIVRR